MKQAIKDSYKVDMETIRNLSEVVKKLQAGGLTIPGEMSVKGTLWANGGTSLQNTNFTLQSSDEWDSGGLNFLRSDETQYAALRPNKVRLDSQINLFTMG